MKDIFTQFCLVVVSVAIVYTVAVNQNVTVRDISELSVVSCGWPLEFIVDDQTEKDPPFPYTTSCLQGEVGDTVAVNWLNLLINIILFYSVAGLLVYVNGFKVRRGKKL